MFCSKCGEKLKKEAKFCHACGVVTKAGQTKTAGTKTNSKGTKVSAQSWLNSFGAFLFIPIFAIIIVLLFWANNDPEPLAANSPQPTSAQGGGEPNQAAMSQVHNMLESLKSRLEANPKDLVAIDSLAVMHAMAGSFDKAKGYYEMHLEIEPDNIDIKVGLALTYHNLQQTDNAIATLEEVLAKDPKYVYALHYLAEIYASSHEHEKAIDKWNLVIKYYPDSDFSKMATERIEAQSHSEE